MPESASSDNQKDIRTLDDTSSETSGSTEETVAQKETNEVFLGGMVVVVLCLLLAILIGTFGYFGYRLWKSAQVERAIPSIQELGEKQVTVSPEGSSTNPQPEIPAQSTPEPTTPQNTQSVDLASVEVKVLNGGASRGSAGTLVDILKKAGYTKAAFGNTVADYTGTKIFYGAQSQSAAEKVKELVAKTYPDVVLAPAEANDKDATAAAIVVILGK